MQAFLSKHRATISAHFSSAFFVTAGLMVTKLLALAASVLVANYAGAETFGEYTLFTSVFIIASTVPEQLDNSYVIKANDIKQEHSEEAFRLTCLISKMLLLAGVLVITGLAYLCVMMLKPSLMGSYMFIAVAIVSGLLVNFYNSIVAYYRCKKAFLAVAIRKPLLNLLLLCAFGGVVLLAKNAISRDFIQWAHFFVGLALFFIVLVWASRRLGNFFSQALAVQNVFIRHSGILLLSSVLSLVANRLDVFFLANTISLEELGYYGVALRVAAIASMFTVVISTILLPSAPKALSSKRAFRRFLMKSGFYLFGQAAIAIVLMLVSGFLISILFSGQPEITEDLANLLIFQSFLVAAGTPFLSLIQSGNSPYFLIGIAVLRGLVGVFLMLWLVPLVGVKGGAYGVIVTAGMVSSLMIALCIFQYRNLKDTMAYG